MSTFRRPHVGSIPSMPSSPTFSIGFGTDVGIAQVGFVLLTMMLLFAGNGKVFGIELYWPIWILAFAWRIVWNRQSRRMADGNLAWWLAVLISFGIVSALARTFHYQYYWWFIKVPLTALAVEEMLDWTELGVSKHQLRSWAPYISFAVFGSLFAAPVFAIAQYRGGFIFGPNVLYRVLAVCIVTLIALEHHRYGKTVFHRRALLHYALLLFLTIAMIRTGSRGATLELAVIAMVLVKSKGRFSRRPVLKTVAFAFVVGLLVLVAYLFGPGRSLTFQDAGGTSISGRIAVYVAFADRFPELALSFGLSSMEYTQAYGLIYPHNLLMELVFYFGTVGLLLALTVLFAGLSYLIRFFRLDLDTRFAVAFVFLLVIGVGSMLSGNLEDNYTIFSLLLVCGRTTVRRAT